MGRSSTIKDRLLSGLGNRPLVYQLRLLVAATVLPLLFLSYMMYDLLVNNERENIRQGLLLNAKTLASLVDTEIETHAAIAATLAQSPALQTGDLPAFWSEARKALEFVPGSWLAVSNPEGNMVLNTLLPAGTALPKHAVPDLIARGFATGRFQIGDLVFGPTSKRLTAFVEMPVFHGGKPLYSLSISLPPKRFLDLLEKRYTQGEVVAIIDRRQKFVARIPGHEERLGTYAADGWRAQIARASEGWSENVSVEGNPILTGYTQTKYGWTVGVARLTADLERPLRAILWSTAAGAGLFIILSLALAWWLAMRAAASMTALVKAASAMGDGRHIPAKPLHFSEARVIAKVLETVSGELHTRGEQLALANSQLENKVAERTQELSAEMQRREEIEATLRQNQKMEAIGQLTGGIAHDFNNMLTIVLGNLDTVKRRLQSLDAEQAARLAKPVDAALQGGRNAAKLTHRLLAFAREQALSPVSVDLRQLVAGMSDMLTRSVGENIRIETVSGAGLWPTLADANQLESALLNLIINARDAMPGGGRITIETSNAYLDEAYAARFGDVKDGQYVMLSVSDTGSGIPADRLAKVFEPFFTTKDPGKGTGLGLAMVHGFVKQSGGHIRIYSETGLGTAVKIYLPRLKGEMLTKQAAVKEQCERAVKPAVAGESILLVEDDNGVREYATDVLEELGYRVQAAASAEEALQYVSGPGRLDLLFTDVVLGGSLNGRQIADEVSKLRPHIPVLFTTGYTRNAIVHRGQLDDGVHLLTKPYTSHELGEKVRSLLDTKLPAIPGA